MGRPRIDLIGQKFERLKVIKDAGVKNGNSTWICLCDCGNTTIVSSNNLKANKVKSCGCLHFDVMKTVDRKRKTHGEYKTRLYQAWAGMKKRCTLITNKKYKKNYIDRGIKFWDGWKEYEPFREWALKNGYKDDLTLDRINNDENYHPDNCRWATVSEQNINKRDNKIIEFNGNTMTVSELSRITGIQYDTLKYRIKMGLELTKPIKRRKAD